MKTPELDKMRDVKEKSQAIGEFLDIFCRERGYVLCKFKEYGKGSSDGEYLPVIASIEEILAEHFGINLIKVEKERQSLLERLRKNQGI